MQKDFEFRITVHQSDKLLNIKLLNNRNIVTFRKDKDSQEVIQVHNCESRVIEKFKIDKNTFPSIMCHQNAILIKDVLQKEIRIVDLQNSTITAYKFEYVNKSPQQALVICFPETSYYLVEENKSQNKLLTLFRYPHEKVNSLEVKFNPSIYHKVNQKDQLLVVSKRKAQILQITHLDFGRRQVVDYKHVFKEQHVFQCLFESRDKFYIITMLNYGQRWQIYSLNMDKGRLDVNPFRYVITGQLKQIFPYEDRLYVSYWTDAPITLMEVVDIHEERLDYKCYIKYQQNQYITMQLDHFITWQIYDCAQLKIKTIMPIPEQKEAYMYMLQQIGIVNCNKLEAIMEILGEL